GILGGIGTISGVVTVNTGGTISPGTASVIGTLNLGSAPTFNGTNFIKINRNGGSALADKIVRLNGGLNYSGTLVVSNIGATLVGGEIFTNFTASSYTGAFANTILPTLTAGLNWYLGGLTTNGTIKVNRRPIANSPLTFTNTAPNVLQIPLAILAGNATDADGDALTVSGVDLTTTNGITLSTTASSVSYSNRVSVTDQFSYTISDGRGGSATGLVNIVNISSGPSAQFAGTPTAIGTAWQLHFTGTPGWTYYLDRSTNLPVWTTIWTNVAPSSGVFDSPDDFPDLNQPPANAFYRLWWTPRVPTIR
ncbi:MAG: Ig-like domain-containing protein, partial [Limisphaerales bacterium]